jgi:hypothetical protein
MIKKLLLLASNIPAALSGGGIFLLLLFVFKLGAPLAIFIGISGYVITGLLIFPATPAIEKQRQEMLGGVLKEGKNKLTQIRTLSKQIKTPQMSQKINSLCEVGENIFEAVRKKSEHVRSAQQFSNYYLDTTIKIIKKYLELSEHRAYSDDVQLALAKVERMLDDVQGAFEKQLSSLLRDEVLDLDTELAVLEETIEIENL